MELGYMAELGCNDECSYDKRCLTRACWQEAYKLRQDFWGKPSAAQSNRVKGQGRKKSRKFINA
jgi:hypothetical protein